MDFKKFAEKSRNFVYIVTKKTDTHLGQTKTKPQ